MTFVNLLKERAKLLLYNSMLLGVVTLIISIPFFNELNNLFLDPLQGDIKPSNEVVIIAIDDESLGEIGAWPWDRRVFAQAMRYLNEASPKAVAMDILFFEERKGDSEFLKSLNDADYPVVLGSKFVDGNLIESVFNSKNVVPGYTNFVPDTDGKIRRSTITAESLSECTPSFAFSTVREFTGDTGPLDCDDPVIVGTNEYDKTLIFNSTQSEFTTFSFVDLYQGKLTEAVLRDKIIMIGATPIDLKSNLLDNFTDIFGRSTPGVIIHANIVNSFLQGEFRGEVSLLGTFIPILLVTLFLLLMYKLIKSTLVEFTLFFGVLVINNVVGLLLFETGANYLFFHTNVLLLISYFFFIAWKYLVESRKKQFLRKAFSQYINEYLLDELMEDPEKLQLGGEEKEITVMFTDIQGYSSIAEKMTPEQLLNLTNEYFDIQTNLILENNGTIDKYIGDAIMAFWNAPVDDPEHKIHAIHTGLSMIDGINEFNKIHPELPEVNSGIGINTDRMVVGNMGSKKRYSYTLIGDGVNLASRVEGLTRKYGVNFILTENVIERVDLENQNFDLRLIDIVKVKGKEISVKLYDARYKSEEFSKLKEDYEKGFEHYQRKEFDQAEEIFRSYPDDSVSKLMLERIPEIRNNPDWDGVWKWEKK